VIVEELLIKLGFDDGQADRKIVDLRKSLTGLVGAFGVGALFSKLADEAGQAVDASRALAKQLGAIEALMPGETAALQGMEETIQRLAVTFGRSTAEIGQGLEGAIQSFNDADTAVGALELAVKTASASGATTADALRLLSAVTKAYGDTSAKTQQKVADLGQQTVLIGDVQMADLASSIGRVTPLASTLGIGLEELFAVFAAGTGPLGGAAEVSTQYASILRGLLDRTPKMNKAFKKAFAGDGIKTAQGALGKFGLSGTLKKLLAQTDGTAEGIQALFGRAEATNLALFLTQKGSATAARAQSELGKAAGSVGRAFDAQSTGLGKTAFAADVMTAKSKVLQENVGKKLEESFAETNKMLFEFKTIAAEVFVPAVDNIINAFGGAISGTDDWRSALELLRDTLLVIAEVVDGLVMGLATIGNTLAFAGASTANFARNLADRENIGVFRGQEQINREFSRSTTERGKGFAERTRGRIAASQEASQRAFLPNRPTSNGIEDLRTNASRIAGPARSFLQGRPGSGGGLTQALSVGAVTVNVTVPPGTEAQAAARIGDQGAREVMQEILKKAQLAFVSPLAPAGG